MQQYSVGVGLTEYHIILQSSRFFLYVALEQLSYRVGLVQKNQFTISIIV